MIIGTGSDPSQRGYDDYPSVALDRAGITIFRDITFLAAGPASEGCRSAGLAVTHAMACRLRSTAGNSPSPRGDPDGVPPWPRTGPDRCGHVALLSPRR